MIAKAFQPVGWVGGVGAAALACYMLSLQVAAERAVLASLEQEIVTTQQNIRSLQTELGTRGRLQQLERWNADVLALSAPTAGQFLESEVRLASFDMRHQGFGDSSANIRMASAETPPVTLPAAAPEMTLAQVRPESVADTVEAPLIRHASLTVAEPTPLAGGPGATRASSLLDEATLRDLRAESNDEREGGAGN